MKKILIITLSIVLIFTFLLFSFGSVQKEKSEYGFGYDYYRQFDDVQYNNAPVNWFYNDKAVTILDICGVKMFIVSYVANLHYPSNVGTGYLCSLPLTYNQGNYEEYINSVLADKKVKEIGIPINVIYSYEHISSPPNVSGDVEIITEYYRLKSFKMNYNANYFLSVINNITYAFNNGVGDFVFYEDITNNAITCCVDYSIEIFQSIRNLYASVGGIF